MDRKLENVVEIQNSACGRSGIMICISIVKSANNEADQEDDEDNIPYSKKLLKELVLPWDNMEHIICADTYFASVPDAKEFCKNGLCFIFVFKIETRQFPISHLFNIKL